MPIHPPEFDDVAKELATLMFNLPPLIVAIDGRDGDGKTTLGRFLSWYFNVTLLETDLYLLGDNSLRRRDDEIARIVTARLERKLPIIIEGVGVLQTLEDIHRNPDFLIYIRNRNTHWVGGEVAAMLKSYEKKFVPWERANTLIELEHAG
jgi:uridine kinase